MYGLMPPVDSNVKIHEKTEDNIMTLFGNLGQTLNIAVERFVAIGEIIAEENTDIKIDMYEAAKDARKTGKSIERLCELFPMTGTSPTHHIEPLKDYSAVILAARSLLSSVTRILLLVDIVIVKKLLTAKKRATECLEKLESVMNFTEFVRAFSVFGMEITELAYLTGYHHNSFKEERRRAQMFSARQILEKSISILLTSSKNSLIHCDCNIVKENRDTVFCQIRRAMDLIHFVVKDSIFYCSNPSSVTKIGCNQSYENESIYSSIKYITCLIENFRTRFSLNEETKEGNNNVNISQNEFDNSTWSRENYLENKNIVPFANSYMVTNRKYNKYSGFYDAEFRMELTMAFEQLFEKTHDFTDSPYIKHEHRQTILTQCAKIKLELNVYNSILNKNDLNNVDINVKTNKLEDGILKALEELCKQLVISVSSEMLEFNESIKICTKLVNSFHILATSHDLDNLNQRSNKFHDYCDHIFDICKLLQHIAPTENLQVQAKCLAINMRIYGPQVFTAAKILWKYSNSTAALDNFEAFSEMFKWLTNEILLVAKKIFVWIDTSKMQRPQFENCENTSMLTKPYSTSAEEKDIEQYRGLDDKNLTDESNAYQNKYEEDMTDNDILKRAKNMSAMAFLMYQFTKGNGSLRTTQDLFTQAEYFAEEANRLYKVLRHFSYQVPASDNKKDLLGILDRVPTFVQALQFTVKDHTVGKAATFVKVDHVIRETKNLMNVINKVVSKCFECAHKYKLNFTGITSGMNSGSVRGDENLAGGMGDSKGTTSSSEGSM